MRILQGKRALVTGSASGIGRAIAIQLAQQGAHLLLADRDDVGMARTAELMAEAGVDVATFHYDAMQADEVVRLARFAAALPGGIDVLVNNAGVTYRGPTDRMQVEHWDRMLATNLYAPIRLTHELLPTLLTRRDSHLLNVCSVLGLVGMPKVCAYNTVKFGLVGFTESLRSEYGPQGMGVTALCPGLVRTNLFDASLSNGYERQKTPPRWMTTTPERVAHTAIKAIRRNRALVVMEPVARATYAAKRFFPGVWDFVLQLNRRRLTEKRLAYWQSHPPDAATSDTQPPPLRHAA